MEASAEALELEAAAIRIQAAQRGRVARRHAEQRRRSAQLAAELDMELVDDAAELGHELAGDASPGPANAPIDDLDPDELEAAAAALEAEAALLEAEAEVDAEALEDQAAVLADAAAQAVFLAGGLAELEGEEEDSDNEDDILEAAGVAEAILSTSHEELAEELRKSQRFREPLLPVAIPPVLGPPKASKQFTAELPVNAEARERMIRKEKRDREAKKRELELRRQEQIHQEVKRRNEAMKRDAAAREAQRKEQLEVRLRAQELKQAERKKQRSKLKKRGEGKSAKGAAAKPLHERMQEKYANAQQNEERKRKNILAQRRQLYRPIDPDELRDWERRVEVFEDEVRHKRRVERVEKALGGAPEELPPAERALIAPAPRVHHKSRFMERIQQEERERKEAQWAAEEEKRKLMQKKKQYAKVVKELFRPEVDERKVEESERRAAPRRRHGEQGRTRAPSIREIFSDRGGGVTDRSRPPPPSHKEPAVPGRRNRLPDVFRAKPPGARRPGGGRCAPSEPSGAPGGPRTPRLPNISETQRAA